MEVGSSDESMLSEEPSAENAWPRSKTADGGRSGTESETGTGLAAYDAVGGPHG